MSESELRLFHVYSTSESVVACASFIVCFNTHFKYMSFSRIAYATKVSSTRLADLCATHEISGCGPTARLAVTSASASATRDLTQP